MAIPNTPITDPDSARSWLSAMYWRGFLYHPDDDAEDIIDQNTHGEWVKRFSEDDVDFVNAQMAAARAELSETIYSFCLSLGDFDD